MMVVGIATWLLCGIWLKKLLKANAINIYILVTLMLVNTVNIPV